MSPSDKTNNTERGYIIPIGGAEEKFHNPEILDRFVEICGGKQARIGIIPTASELEDTGRNYEKLFRDIGVKHTRVLPFETREDCEHTEYLDYIEEHYNNVQEAWKIINDKCQNKGFRFIYDDFVWHTIDSEVKAHDLSKLSPEEFTQYRQFFFPCDGEEKDEALFKKARSGEGQSINSRYVPKNISGSE